MRRLSLVWVIVGLVAQPALAADRAIKAPAPAAVFDWSGFYVGGNVGSGRSNANWTNVDNTTFFGDSVPPDAFEHGVSGVIGGGQIGFNVQRGAWVFGVEALIDASWMSGDHASTFGAADDQFRARIDTLMLFTGRIGYAWDRLLVYGKGGFGLANIKVSVDDVVGASTGTGNDSNWRSGPTVGFGLEYALMPNLSVGLEYDYLRLDGADYQLGDATGSYLWTVDMRNVSLIMAKLNYRFGLGR